MRSYLIFCTIVLLLAVAAFGGYALAAHLDGDSADAQTTWQVEYFEPVPGQLTAGKAAEPFIESLPANCAVDMETLTDLRVAVAYSCPD